MRPLSKIPLRLLFSLLLLVSLALAGCGERQGSGAEDLGELGPRASIDELQRLKHTARSCEANADCPSGSHCDDDAGRCDWACFADSDCGEPGATCDRRGQCVAAADSASSAFRTSPTSPKLSSVSSQLAANHPSCLALPLPEKLGALEALGDDPAFCFEDLDCPCGSYCGNDATCRFECFYEAPTAPPFCTPGEVCSAEGRCNLPSGSDDPSLIVDLEVTPDLVAGNTAPGPVLIPVDVRVRAKLPANVTAATNATLRLEVLPRSGGPTPFMARVRCAAGAPLATSCTLGAGWPFGGDPDPLRSAARPIWIELPQTTTADEWSIVARSEWASAPVSLSARALPLVEPPHQIGHFGGTLAWTQPGGPPMSVAVTAEVTATHVLLRDPSRLILPDGVAVLSKNLADATRVTWLKSDQVRGEFTHLFALLDIDTWVFTPARQSISSAMRLTLGNGPAPTPLTLELDYQGPTPNATCSSATCGAGDYCDPEIGLCLPGVRSLTSIVPDSYALSTALTSAQRTAWLDATSNMRLSYLPLAGEDIIGMERAACYSLAAPDNAGRIGSSNANLNNLNPGQDSTCTANELDSVAPAFPWAHRTTGVTVNGDGVETFNLFDTCLADLAIAPGAPFTPANLLAPRQCVSLARFLMAMTTPGQTGGPTYPQTARRRLEHQLTRQWVTLHALIARGSVQESEYDETIGGTAPEPMHQRLGKAVDLMEKGWRLLVRARRTDEAEQAAAQQPDSRTLGRPVLHWTFNRGSGGVALDTESSQTMNLTNIPTRWMADNYLTLNNLNTSPSCLTRNAVALPSRHFSVGLFFRNLGGEEPYKMIEKANASHKLQIWLYHTYGTTRLVEVQSLSMRSGFWQSTGSAYFSIPSAPGYVAFVADGARLRVQHVTRNTTTGAAIANEYSPQSVTGDVVWGTAGGVALGCRANAHVTAIDEFTLWDRPLPLTTTTAFAMRYLLTNGSPNASATADSLPPRQLTTSVTDEQAQGLAVHLIDALAAHMELLSAYVRAERGEMFLECGAGAVGPARTRVLDRLGRALRFAQVIENDAGDLVALAGPTAAPWLARYTAAAKLLAGGRAEAVQQLDLASRCGNPLGITDDDLPLYHGTEAGESNRFFASSRFLTAQAKAQVDQAKGELNLARGAWQQQRASAFQVALGAAEKTERLRKIEQEYEGVLRKLCGVPTSGTILAAFRNGTMTSANCFLKREAPGCNNAEQLSVQKLPSQCLRGELGEQILQIQAADLDLRNAENALDRATALYDSEMEYCTRREDHQEETQRIRTEHRAHMIKLRAKRRSAGMFGGFIKAMVGMAVGGLSGNPALAIGSWLNAAGMVLGQPEQEAADNEQDAESQHQLVLAARAAALDLMACFHGADNQKFAIDAADDVIDRAYHATKGAVLRLDNQQAELRALVTQAVGDLEFEGQMVRVLPHHHFWLDDHIDAYRRHFRYAQRLTYLALRAFEYESQQSLALGNTILAAHTPGPLEIAVLALEQRTAPMQGEQGFVAGEFAPVMSLRDEILRLGTTEAPPGFPALSSIDALRVYLKSDDAKIYSAGAYVGRGIRFSLRPPAWAQFSCAERIWRITTALQVEGSPINNARLLLWQENSFGSQRCRSPEHGVLSIARIRPEKNLLVGEGGNFDGTPFIRPLRYTAMEATGLGNKSREQMEDLPEGAHSGFAGRGLYANYVLLFPSAQFDNATFLNTVKDVLIRFDLVSVTDTNDPD